MNFLNLTLRKLKKNKAASLLGLSGLVVGLVCVIYISIWVSNEISYDRFHSKIERIFVVHAYLDEGSGKVDFQGCPPAVGPALKNEYPEVENTCRYIPGFSRFLIRSGEQKFMERTAFSEFSLFDIFSFPFVYGNKGEDGDPNRIILTEATARRYFGNSNPTGMVLNFDNSKDLTVAGVIKDFPVNSSINFDAVIPVENLESFYSRPDYLTSWYNNSFTTFGLLKDQSGFDKIASTITRRIQKEMPESTNYLKAYRFKDGYLYVQKHIRNVNIFVLIALMVLVAAILNFINLNTARSAKQAKETGLRKAIGASRFSMVRLIYSDVTGLCIIAFTAAIICSLAGLPVFNHITGKDIAFGSMFSLSNVTILSALFLSTVLLAGSYPALYLSSFAPGQTLSRNYQTAKSRGIFRNALIVTMFAVSIVLLSSTIIISKQTNHLQNMDLGYEKEQLMYVNLNGKLKEKVSALKEEIGRSAGVLSSCAVSYIPVMIGNNGEGWNWEGKSPDFKPLVTSWNTDEDMVKTLGAKMDEGEFIRKDQEGIVINKTFAKMIGWNDFTGRTINAYGRDQKILGVVNDIRFNSLSEETKPMAIEMTSSWNTNFLMIKTDTKNIASTIDYIGKCCRNLEPAYPFEYSFINDDFARMLASEMNLKKLVSIFSGFAIIVLCLGLLGLVMFFTELRTKEIGIRKCLGENAFELVIRFIKPFVLSGIAAGIIAIPITWLAMGKWLGNYASHIRLSFLQFFLAGILVIAIAVLTVIWQSLRAATKNPVEALRYE